MILGVVLKRREEGLKAWVGVVLEGTVSVPGPRFLYEDGVGLAVPG
jgi:hypothetical protein